MYFNAKHKMGKGDKIAKPIQKTSTARGAKLPVARKKLPKTSRITSTA